jgi:bifunctional non-homologous end joining protein LigD
MPMLAVTGKPTTGTGWVTEFKWDGVRCIVEVADGAVRTWSRSARDVTREYPELAALASVTSGHDLVLDVELVCLDPAGQPDFGLWQRRLHHKPGEVAPDITLFAFDLLQLDGAALIDQPLEARRELLEALDLNTGPVKTPQAYTDVTARDLLEVAKQYRLEGVVAKRVGSRYLPGQRSPDWIKSKPHRSSDVVIGGWTDQKGPGRSIGAVAVGAYDDHGLRYLGRCGSGLDGRIDRVLRDAFKELATAECPFADASRVENAKALHWVEPRLVAEVQHSGLAGDGRLRHPVWRGLRTDVEPTDVRTDQSELV